jgi:predicted transcriptional regulator
MRSRTPADNARRRQAKAVGAELRRARRALELSQGEIARRTGCSQATISRVEKGRLDRPALVQRVASVLIAAGGRLRR